MMSNANTILDGTDVDSIRNASLSFSAPRKCGQGRVINISYSKGAPLHIETPLLFTYGMQEDRDKNKNPKGTWSVALQCPSQQYPDEQGQKFFEFMKILQDKIKDACVDNAAEWQFTNAEEVTRAIVNTVFTDFIKYPYIMGSTKLNKDAAPTMRIKCPNDKDKDGQDLGTWKFGIFSADTGECVFDGKRPNGQHPSEYIPNRSNVSCLLECGGMWVVAGRLTVVWRLSQVVVKPPATWSLPTNVPLFRKRDFASAKMLNGPSYEDEPPLTPSPVASAAMTATIVDEDPEPEPDEVADTHPPSIVPPAAVAAASATTAADSAAPKAKRVVVRKSTAAAAK